MAANKNPLLIDAAQVQSLPEERRPHPLDASLVRHTRSLGDAAGLESIGVHLVRLTEGATSSVQHTHQHDEEWVYILSGRGLANIGDARYEVGAGDFMGFPANSPAHNLQNPNAEDLVYLVGGNRLPHDICDYPYAGKRRYRIDGKNVYVDLDALDLAKR
jgi:uncharacterized cupin superfamily protein